jgi:hypothetical protein
MDAIAFSNISSDSFEAFHRVFLAIKSGKDSGCIDEASVRQELGDRIGYFISDPAEIEKLMESWRKDRRIALPWEFGSCIDSLVNCELRFHTLELRADGSGEFRFEQLAWPSGGLDAAEELVRVFGGKVVSNSAT